MSAFYIPELKLSACTQRGYNYLAYTYAQEAFFHQETRKRKFSKIAKTA